MTGKELAQTFCSLDWRLSFDQFCEVLELDPKHNHAREKWKDFQHLCQAINSFDERRLDALINHYQTTNNQ